MTSTSSLVLYISIAILSAPIIDNLIRKVKLSKGVRDKMALETAVVARAVGRPGRSPVQEKSGIMEATGFCLRRQHAA